MLGYVCVGFSGQCNSIFSGIVVSASIEEVVALLRKQSKRVTAAKLTDQGKL